MAELDVSRLRQVADDYRAALAHAEETRAAADAARREVLRLQHQRREELAALVGDTGDPERMRAAALALGVSTPRVYQLLRHYTGKVNDG